MSRTEIPLYDTGSLGAITRGYPVSSGFGAIRVAATTMDGACTNRDGTIHARQTNCHVLRYSEHPSRSRGAGEGRKATLGAFNGDPVLVRLLGRKAVSAADLDHATSLWLKANGSSGN